MNFIKLNAIFLILYSTILYSQQKKKSMKNDIPNSVEIIDSHLDEFFDENSDIVVFDEIKSETIHRDIFFIKATEERPYHILLSCGMSALQMNIPKDVNSSKYIEIMFLLPKEWNLNYEAFHDEKNYWPIRIMKEIMISPHENKSWFGYGHTFQFDDKEEFAEGIGFNSVMLANSMELSEEFTTIPLKNKKQIDIYTLIPLYPEELEFKKNTNANELLEKFDKNIIEEIVKIGRKNVCK